MFDDENQKPGGIAAYARRLKGLPGAVSDAQAASPAPSSISRRALLELSPRPTTTPAPSVPGEQANATLSPQDSISRRALAGQSAQALGLTVQPVGVTAGLQDSISRRALAGQPAQAPGLTVQPWANPTGAQDSISRRALRETSQPGVFKATAPGLSPQYTNTPGQSAQAPGLTVQPGANPAGPPTSIRQMAMRDAQQSVQPQDNQPVPANSIYRAAMQGATPQPMNDTQMSIASVARANQIRQQQVDMQQPGGAGVLADPNEALNAERTARWREDELIKKAQYSPQLASIASQALQGNTARDLEAARQPAVAANIALQARGQDINREAQAGQQSISSRALEMNNARDKERLALDQSRFGLEQQDSIAKSAAREGLSKAMQSGDQGAIARARAQAAALGVKLEPQANLLHVETDRGMMVFDPRTGQMAPALGADGQPVASSKALTEYQGKSTGFGMRADRASKIIDEVGQGGKVQPSLLKRAAESVPLVGEGLGMMANALQSPEQQQVEQAQRDFVNAVLRQESGAAISQGEFDNARKQYFPQPGDSPEVVAQKQANREAAINGFRVSAGPGARSIGESGQAAQPTQPAQQQPKAPSVGAVEHGHVYVGGNPADPSSWVEVRK